MLKSLLASTLVLAAGVSLAEDAPQTPRDLVKINGKPLTELHFALYQNQQGSRGQTTPQSQMVLLNQLINTTMLSVARARSRSEQRGAHGDGNRREPRACRGGDP